MLRSSLAATARLGVVGRISKLPCASSSLTLWQETRRFQSSPVEDTDFPSDKAGRSSKDGPDSISGSSPAPKSSQKKILDKFFSGRKESAPAKQQNAFSANPNGNEPRQQLRNAISQVSNNNNNGQQMNTNGRSQQRNQGVDRNGNNFSRPNQQQQQSQQQQSQQGQQNPNQQSRANGNPQQQQQSNNGNNQNQASNRSSFSGGQRQGQGQTQGQQQQQQQGQQQGQRLNQQQGQQQGQRPNQQQQQAGQQQGQRPNHQQQQAGQRTRHQQQSNRRPNQASSNGQGQSQQNYNYQNRQGQGQGQGGPQRQQNQQQQQQQQQQPQRNQQDPTKKDGSTLSTLFQTLRKPASSAAASSTNSNARHDDPIEALRRKFLPNSDGKANADSPASQSTASSRKDMSDVSNLSAALFKMPKPDSNGQPISNNNNNSSQANNAQQRNPNRRQNPSATTSEKSKFQSPLSEFIRVIQMKHAEEKAKKDPEESPLSNVPRTPLPKWRLQTNRLREMRRQRNDKRNHGAELPTRFQQPAYAPRVRKRPVKIDPRLKMTTLPSHDISLMEASLLFRQRTAKLKRILRKLGEFPKNASDKDDEIMLGVDALELVALELGAKFQLNSRKASVKDEEVLMQRRAAAEETYEAGAASYESFAPRPPVVCIMGHVDHGKTTLMDSLRRRALGLSGGDGAVKEKTKKSKSKKGGKKDSTSGSKNVAGTEAGGITQVVSAFQVPLDDQDEVVTFLDTPGHAAFKAMRQSGSDAADIIVLVVAADDGVSEQTIEILNFYKSIVKGSGGGGISLVVAMNKIDKPGIDVDESLYRIQNELLAQGILTEGFGGSEDGEYGPPVQLIPVSGLTGLGIDELIEGLALQSEIMDLRADDTARAEGIVLDARVVKGMGVVADCIIRWGTMQKGDHIVSGVHAGKIKILKDVNEKMLMKGLPSQPVRVVGFETVPKAGDPIICVESEEVAEDLVTRRKASLAGDLEAASSTSSGADLQSSGKHLMNHEWKKKLESKYSLNNDDPNAPIRIPVIVKADADGTLAAIRDSLIQVGKQSSHNVFIDPVLVGVGPVLASDILFAKESNAGIFCFNIKNESMIEKLADEEGVTLLRDDIIYALLDASKNVFAKYLPAVPVEVVHGRARVKQVYDIGGVNSQVAGLNVLDGTLYKDKTKGESGMLSCQFRIIRNGKVISPEGALRATSLKRFKDDVNKVGRGDECGLSLDGHNGFEEDDEIECFSVDMKREFI